MKGPLFGALRAYLRWRRRSKRIWREIGRCRYHRYFQYLWGSECRAWTRKFGKRLFRSARRADERRLLARVLLLPLPSQKQDEESGRRELRQRQGLGVLFDRSALVGV